MRRDHHWNRTAWLVLRRDTGQHLGTHVLRNTVTEERLQVALDAWALPVCLFNTDTKEVFY